MRYRPARAAGARRWLALLVLCTAWFLDMLDFSIVNVALPDIQQSLGFSQHGLQWVVSAYALTLGGFLLLGGRAADFFGRRRIFLAGLGLFTMAALVGGFAQTPEVLIAARAVQGFGTAISAPAALSIVTTTFPEVSERNRALGIWSAVGSGAIAAGVVLGGVITEIAGWRWVMWINVPVGLAAIALTPALIRGSSATSAASGDVSRGWAGLDLPGAASVTSGLLVLVYALSEAEGGGFASPVTLGGMALALVLLAVFLLIESRARNPLVPLGIFRSRQLTGANLGALAVGFYGAVFLVLSLYKQQVLGYSALTTGLAFVPMAVAGVAASSFLGPPLADRFGARSPLAGGLAAMTAGLVLLARIPADATYWSGVLPGTVLLAAGMGVAFTAFTVGAVEGVEEKEQGLASGLVNTSLQIGTALAVAILLTVAAARTAALSGGGTEAVVALAAGFRYSFVAAAVVTAAGALLTSLLMRRRSLEYGADRGKEGTTRG